MPGDSVSQVGSEKPEKKNKNRKGKNARNRGKKSATSTTPSVDTKVTSTTIPTSFRNNQSVGPTPEPGRWPVVFSVTAGHPTTEIAFQPLSPPVEDALSHIDTYTMDANFARYSRDFGYTHLDFTVSLHAVLFLSLAQQIVFSHVNMGRPAGDFFTLQTTRLQVPSALLAFVRQYGELPFEGMGKLFVLANYRTTVSSLVLAAQRAFASKKIDHAISNYLWLPMEVRDSRTCWIVATKIATLLLDELNITLEASSIAEVLYSGNCPALLQVLLNSTTLPNHASLFAAYPSAVTFDRHLRDRTDTYQALGLVLPQAPWILDFNFSVQDEYPLLARKWLARTPAISSWFNTSTIADSASSAQGSLSQFAKVETAQGITSIHSLSELDPQSYSLVACFPASAALCPRHKYNTFLTTSASTLEPAFEFLQRDWKKQ